MVGASAAASLWRMQPVNPIKRDPMDEVDARLLSSGRLTRALTAFLVLPLAALTGLTLVLVSRIFARLTPAIRQDLEWKTLRGAHEMAERADLGIVLRD